MTTPLPNRQTFRSLALRAWGEGLGIAAAVMFWVIIAIIALVATAQSAKPWDTVIAALAMGSQAFFAYMVYRLGKNQYAFTKQITERQHKIDAFQLRQVASNRLEELSNHLMPIEPIKYETIEAFRLLHIEIARLFSDKADDLAFELYQYVEQAKRQMRPVEPLYNGIGEITNPGDDGINDDVRQSIDDAIDILLELQDMLNDEMRIR